MSIPVLLLARELDIGGSERQMTEMAKALDRSEFEPHVGCFRVQGMRADELRDSGIPVVHFPIHSYKSPSALINIAKLAGYVRRNRIRIVHTWDYPSTVSAIPATRMLTSATALSSQRSHRELIPDGYLRITRISDRFAHGIVVNCDFLQRHLIADERVPAAKIHVCYNGIDLDRFRRLDISKPPPLANSQLVIGVVCGLRREKDLVTLIDAFARVRNLKSGIMLLIVGSGRELLPLQERAAQHGIAEACHFEPATRNVAAWLSAIDIFVLPSRSEALSNALMEAMACGCCAVASDVGGNPELVSHGDTGLLFRAGDASALAAALCDLIQNDSFRAALAARGQQLIRTRFSTATAAGSLGRIYSRVCAIP